MDQHRCRMGTTGCYGEQCDEVGHGDSPEMDLFMMAVLEGCHPFVAAIMMCSSVDYVRGEMEPPSEMPSWGAPREPGPPSLSLASFAHLVLATSYGLDLFEQSLKVLRFYDPHPLFGAYFDRWMNKCFEQRGARADERVTT